MNEVAARIAEQIELVERLIQEGRQSIERWGWVFVMWGVAHISATVWSQLWTSRPGMPWMILMSAAGLATAIGGARAGRRRKRVSTLVDRAQGSTWVAFAISGAILFSAGQATHSIDYSRFATMCAVLFVLLGGANFISGQILRLGVQVGVGVLWWGSAVLVMVVPEVASWVLVAMAVVGEILFGLYLVMLERRRLPARA